MTTHTLFDPQSVGTSLEPMEETGNLHQYLSASARPEIAAVRRFWEHAFVDYPQAAKPAFVDRFRGEEFREALFELYVFSLLRAEGYRPEVIPVVANASTTDFAVNAPNGEQIFVEAFTVDCDPALSRLDDALAPLKDALGRLQSPVGFSVEVCRSSTSTLPHGKMARAINAWLVSEELVALAAQAMASGESCVTRVFQHADWELEIEAHITGPLSSLNRKRGAGLTLWGTGGHFLDPTRRLAKRLKNKAERYDVDGSLVLAVSPMHNGIDHDDIEPALYGPTLATETWGGTVTLRREGGGLWLNKDGTIRNRSIPTVIMCPNVFPATVGSVLPVCYECPEPRRPLKGLLPRCTLATLDGLQVQYHKGLTGQEYFGLHEGWPR